MNKNKFQSDSGGTNTKNEDERFLTVMNQVLEKHYTIAAKNHEN